MAGLGLAFLFLMENKPTIFLSFSHLNFLVAIWGKFLFISVPFIFLWYMKSVTLGLPTLFGSFAYFAIGQEKGILKSILFLIVPLLSVLFFGFHDVGLKAIVYSFYWFIPVAIYFFSRVKRISFFTWSIAISFIMHGVGSVIWLYRVPTKPDYWLTLIPIVLFERLLIAMGIFTVHLLSIKFLNFLKSNGAESVCFFLRNLIFSRRKN